MNKIYIRGNEIATKEYVDSLSFGGGENVDLSNYYTKEEIDDYGLYVLKDLKICSSSFSGGSSYLDWVDTDENKCAQISAIFNQAVFNHDFRPVLVMSDRNDPSEYATSFSGIIHPAFSRSDLRSKNRTSYWYKGIKHNRSGNSYTMFNDYIALESVGLEVIGEWQEDGSFKCTSYAFLLSSQTLAQSEWTNSNFLKKSNTTSYTPTKDYHPATKKYVDDKFGELADMGFTPMIVESLPIDDIQTSTIYMMPNENGDSENIYEEWMYINGVWEKVGSTSVKPSLIPVIVTSENIANSSLTLADVPKQINTILPANYDSISKAPMVLELITTSFANGMKYVLFEFNYSSSHTSKLEYVGYHYDTANSGSLPTIYRCVLTITLSQSNGVYTCDRVSYSRAKTHQYLSTTNTTEFTPTGDYNPATKKYIDDIVGDINSILDAINGEEV